jgi:hypothetical protein
VAAIGAVDALGASGAVGASGALGAVDASGAVDAGTGDGGELPRHAHSSAMIRLLISRA